MKGKKFFPAVLLPSLFLLLLLLVVVVDVVVVVVDVDVDGDGDGGGGGGDADADASKVRWVTASYGDGGAQRVRGGRKLLGVVSSAGKLIVLAIALAFAGIAGIVLLVFWLLCPLCCLEGKDDIP